ncbi:MAG: hypothetical protein H0X00_05285 [Sporichthya sp.]|nr:hypothetical protein [Sporichthya sp.]
MARLHRKAGAAVCAVLGLAIVPLISADAQADATYAAVAEATGTRVILTNQSIPLNVAPQLQGPTASAVQNSLQQSDAYAAFPYPGEEVAGIPGVVGGAAGVPLPAYPFVIATSFGDGAKQLSYPGIELRAESTETLTQSTATGGSTGAGGTSSARVARDGDDVVAKAVTDLDALRIGESLVISGLHAVATASRDSAGKLTRASELSFTRLSAPGFVIGLTNGKFTLQNGTEAPAQNDVPLAQIAAALSGAGYPTTFQVPQETPDGIIGAGLQIQTTLPAPPAGTPGGFSGETPVTYTIGLLRAEVAYTVLPTTPAAADTGVDAGVDAATGVPGAPALPTTDLAGLPGTVPVLAPVAAPVAGIDLASLQASRAAVGSDVGWIYLMVAAVGLAAVGGCAVLYRGAR